jgi:hypothetical protein
MEEFVLYDTYTNDSDEVVKDFCEANEIEIPNENSNDYWDIFNEEKRFEWEDCEYCIKKIDKKIGKVCVIGNLGLWSGKREIVPTFKDSLLSAIYSCLKDCDYCKIEYIKEKKCFKVKGSHHDGTNVFEIYCLPYGYEDDEEYEDDDKKEVEKVKNNAVDVFTWIY